MYTNVIEQDLADMLAHIDLLTRDVPHLDETHLQPVAKLLEEFVAHYREQLTWADFPLAQAAGQVLCSYRLHGDSGDTLCLELQAINAGVHTPIHDHGTWAILVAVIGSECHQVYRAQPDAVNEAGLHLVRDVAINPGTPLVLEMGEFHRMSTQAPALQLHLYGKPLEHVPARRIIDEKTGGVVYVQTVV